MARNVTLVQLRQDISDQCDITVGNAARYTPTHLNRLINQSIQRFREKLSSEGCQHYLVSTSSALGTGATSPYPFYSLDLSAVTPSIVRVYGLDLTVTSNDIRTLPYVDFAERDKYGAQSGTPMAWSNFGTRKIAIFPPSSTAYTYVVWYLPVLADLSSDADTFDGVAGWEDFIVWDVVCRLIAKDNYATQYQLALNQCDRLWADILRNATRVVSAGGAHIGRDTMARRWNTRTRNLPAA
jgi:hypothetical protein